MWTSLSLSLLRENKEEPSMPEGSPKKLVIHTDTITLTQALKLSHLVSTGGQAKALVAQGGVKVNGAPEHRRNRKLKPGDVIFVEPLAVVLEICYKEARRLSEES
jgi:ribosome-associated protein